MKKKAYLSLFAFLLVMVVIEVLFAHPHHHMPWNTIPGADIFIGFVGAWILICLSKITLASLIQRPTDYYDRNSSSAGQEEGGVHHD